jgi:uncharacterized protein
VTPSPRASTGTTTRGSGRARVPSARPAGTGDRSGAAPTPAARPFSLATLFKPGAAAGAPPPERTRPWWGFGDVLLWWVLGFVGSQICLGILIVQGGYGPPGRRGSRVGEGIGRLATDHRVEVARTVADMPLWMTQVVVLLPLWAAFIGGAIYATVHKGFGPVRDLKISFRPIDAPVGLAVGLFGQLLLVPAVYRLLFVFTGEQDVSAAARTITDKATSPALVVLVFLTVGIVAPVAEELFFRGLALQSLTRRFGPLWGLLGSSAFFAAVHLNPLLFVALMPFAMVLAALVLHFDRLGPAIVAHVAFNLATAVLLVSGWEASLPW